VCQNKTPRQFAKRRLDNFGLPLEHKRSVNNFSQSLALLISTTSLRLPRHVLFGVIKNLPLCCLRLIGFFDLAHGLVCCFVPTHFDFSQRVKDKEDYFLRELKSAKWPRKTKVSLLITIKKSPCAKAIDHWNWFVREFDRIIREHRAKFLSLLCYIVVCSEPPPGPAPMQGRESKSLVG
jgi:hypothetical protein